MESAMSNVSHKDVEVFSNGCALSRSIYRFMVRLFKDSNPTERTAMISVVPYFSQTLAKCFRNTWCWQLSGSPIRKRISRAIRILPLNRQQLKVAIRKLAAHSDVAAVRGPPLDAGSWAEWDQFWTTLKDFVRILNEQTAEKPFDVDDADVSGNANKLLTALGGPKGGATERAQ
jgi:hypothetical protein